MDFEAWRCTSPHTIDELCPEEGCIQGFCARENGWSGVQPGPTNQEQKKLRDREI